MLSSSMFSPRTQSTCSGLYSSSVVRLCLPTHQSTLAALPLSAFVAILDAASSISPVFATLTKNTRGGVYSSLSANPLNSACPDAVGALKSSRALPSTDPFDTRLGPIAAIPFIIRTSAKCARNRFGMNTSKTKDLKLFRMNTSKKTGRGRGPSTAVGMTDWRWMTDR